MAGPEFGKGGGGGGGMEFMRLCTAATTPPFDAHAHRCNESGCCCLMASNCRETASPSGSTTGYYNNH